MREEEEEGLGGAGYGGLGLRFGWEGDFMRWKKQLNTCELEG